MTTTKRRLRCVWLLVGGHVGFLALAIVATRLILGSRGALTPANQFPWASITWAQMALLALHFGMGGQRFDRRLTSFLAGMAIVIGAELFAWYLFTGSPPRLGKWLGTWFFQLAALYVPEGLCVAALVMAARPVAGLIAPAGNEIRGAGQFALRDLIGFMTFAAVVVGLLRWTFALEFADFTRFFAYFPLIVGGRASGLLGSAILVLGARRRWIGVPLLAAAIAAEFVVWSPRDTFDWLSFPYRWGVVLGSLAVVRVAGYRLMGGKLDISRVSNTDHARDVSPLNVR